MPTSPGGSDPYTPAVFRTSDSREANRPYSSSLAVWYALFQTSSLPRRPGEPETGDVADRRVAGESPEPGCEGRSGHGAQAGELAQAPGVLGLLVDGTHCGSDAVLVEQFRVEIPGCAEFEQTGSQRLREMM